jgi:hypothetical protein
VSLKGVELQIAIPKTFDAGKIAEQHQQNTINQQLHAQELLKREIERKQLSVNEMDNLENVDGDEERNDGDHEQSSSHSNLKKKAQQQPKAQHPFKGNLFDVSG